MKRNLEEKVPYILYVWLSMVFSLIQCCNEFPPDNSNSINEFI